MEIRDGFASFGVVVACVTGIAYLSWLYPAYGVLSLLCIFYSN